MKKIIFLPLIILLLCSKIGYSQAENFSLYYSMGFPMGKLSDHIENVSFRGMGFDMKFFTNDNVALGFGMTWSTFYNSLPYDTYTSGTLSVSGKQYRYFNSLPIHAYASYYLGMEEAPIRPFASLGIGTAYNEKRTEMGVFMVEDKGWLFSIQPEVGVLLKATDYNSLLISAKYNAPFKSSAIDSYPYLSLNVGFSFGM
jgi:hypothetical protein